MTYHQSTDPQTQQGTCLAVVLNILNINFPLKNRILSIFPNLVYPFILGFLKKNHNEVKLNVAFINITLLRCSGVISRFLSQTVHAVQQLFIVLLVVFKQCKCLFCSFPSFVIYFVRVLTMGLIVSKMDNFNFPCRKRFIMLYIYIPAAGLLSTKPKLVQAHAFILISFTFVLKAKIMEKSVFLP